jgi:hypothetical protein
LRIQSWLSDPLCQVLGLWVSEDFPKTWGTGSCGLQA